MEYHIHKGENELVHWGVRGMRWGIRRYQNKDGSLTPAGKKRYNAELEKVREREKTLKNRQSVKARMDRLAARKKAVEDGEKELDGDEAKVKKKSKGDDDVADKVNNTKKSIADMTDEELQRAVNRSRLEEQYRQLNPEPPVKQSFMKKMMSDVVAPAAINSGKKFLENALNKAAENALKGKVDPNSLEALTKVRDKLKIQQEIEKLKSGKSDVNWSDKLKQQAWEKNERERAKAEAAEKAAADKAKADEAARKANEATSREYYNSTYRSGSTRFGAETVSTGRSETSSVIKALPSSTSNVPPKTISTGRSTVAGLLSSQSSGNMSGRPTNEVGYIDEGGRFHAY